MRVMGRGALCFAFVTALVLGGGLSPHPAVAAQGVSVVDYAYNPDPITITPGTSVTWTNRGTLPHTVTSDDGSSEQFDSNTLQPGVSFSHTFTHAGAFTYHCLFHDNMLGTIVVEDSPGSASTPSPTATPVPSPTSTPTRVKAGPDSVLAVPSGSNYRYRPATLKIKVRTRVTWQNASNTSHTITSTTHGWKLNRTLGLKAKLTVTFKKSGTFTYHCLFHPGMTGKIIVHR